VSRNRPRLKAVRGKHNRTLNDRFFILDRPTNWVQGSPVNVLVGMLGLFTDPFFNTPRQFDANPGPSPLSELGVDLFDA